MRKIYMLDFLSNFSNKWEVAGMLFVSTETKEKVEIFKSSRPYRIYEGVTKFIFFTDKDLDYIEPVIAYPSL